MARAVGVASKSQRAYDYLKQKIVSGEFRPGHRLVLAAVAGDLSVSVVPVREAIRSLEAEGLVTFERNVGAQVAVVDEREYAYTMQTLSLLEGFATALSAPLLDRDRLARCRDLNAQMQASLSNFDPRRFSELDLELHALLCSACPNPHVIDLVQRGWNRLANLRDALFSFVPGRAHATVEEHAHLLTLIEGGVDAAAIESAARAHRANTLDAFLAHQGRGMVPSGMSVDHDAADVPSAR